MDAILRQIPHLRVLGQQHATAVRLHGPHNALHEGGFTGTVMPRKGHARALLHHKGERIKQHARPEGDRQLLNGENQLLAEFVVPALDVRLLLREEVGAVIVDLDTEDAIPLANSIHHGLILTAQHLT